MKPTALYLLTVVIGLAGGAAFASPPAVTPEIFAQGVISEPANDAAASVRR